MAQITTGFRSILSTPFFYDSFQKAVGATRARRIICRDHLRVREGHVLVDVGCGTAEILDHLPSGISYFGFDLSQEYIDAARLRFGNRGTFYCADISRLPMDAIPPCNVALSFGVLHHLDDDEAEVLLKHVHSRLLPGGRFVTVDPAFAPGQSVFARALIKRDRGQNVRDGSGYAALAKNLYRESRVSVRHDLLNIPYTHALVEHLK